jgi:membrane-associated protease RseP (regulator of RpoE activity)
VAYWEQGLIYTGAVLAILMFHEMGHFIATLVHRIPASLPFFIPWPLGPFGTMGAVIGMAGHRANRRELFDIGIAGPLAGLVVAIPFLYLGVQQLDLSQAGIGPYRFDLPVVARWMISSVRPDLEYVESIAISQLNPYFMAAWVGLLITGLNMMPISQLDGGHVIYALLLKKGHLVARLFLLAAITYVLVSGTLMWILMILIVTLIGTDHPPTADDSISLGWFRTILGVASLSIPFLCFPPRGLLM